MSISSPLRVALVSCPANNVRYPPYGLASLASSLRSRGYEVNIFDLNIDAWHNAPARFKKTFGDLSDHYWGYLSPASDDLQKKRWRYISDAVVRPHLARWADEILEVKPDFIGFSLFAPSVMASRELANQLMKHSGENRSFSFVYGGPYLTRAGAGRIKSLGLPDGLIFLGESEDILPEYLKSYANTDIAPSDFSHIHLISDLSGNELWQPAVVKDLSKLKSPDYSDFELGLYSQKRLPISSGRGCTGKCVFCESGLYGGFRSRPAIQVAEEMAELNRNYEIKEFEVISPLINPSKAYLKSLAASISDKNNNQFRWQASARPEGFDRAISKSLVNSGCAGLALGMESGSRRILKSMGRDMSPEKAANGVKELSRAGIKVCVNFIAGFPGESWLDFMKTLKWIYTGRKHISQVVAARPLIVTEGTELWNNYHQWGISDRADGWRWQGRPSYFIRLLRRYLIKRFCELLNIECRIASGAPSFLIKNKDVKAEAYRLAAEGKFDLALNKIDNCMNQYCDDRTTHSKKVEWHIILKDMQGALKAARDWLNNFPEDTEAYEILFSLLKNQPSEVVELWNHSGTMKAGEKIQKILIDRGFVGEIIASSYEKTEEFERAAEVLMLSDNRDWLRLSHLMEKASEKSEDNTIEFQSYTESAIQFLLKAKAEKAGLEAAHIGNKAARMSENVDLLEQALQFYRDSIKFLINEDNPDIKYAEELIVSVYGMFRCGAQHEAINALSEYARCFSEVKMTTGKSASAEFYRIAAVMTLENEVNSNVNDKYTKALFLFQKALEFEADDQELLNSILYLEDELKKKK